MRSNVHKAYLIDRQAFAIEEVDDSGIVSNPDARPLQLKRWLLVAGSISSRTRTVERHERGEVVDGGLEV